MYLVLNPLKFHITAVINKLCYKSLMSVIRNLLESHLDICQSIKIYRILVCITQRQTQELISGPCLGVKARFLSFHRIQSRVVTGLLTGHNTLRRHLHLLGLSDSLLCRMCGAEDETSVHILCEYEALASHRYVYLGSFLEPEDIRE
jgi:hypothetical protein